MQHHDHVCKFGHIHASECRASVDDELHRIRPQRFRQRLDRPIRAWPFVVSENPPNTCAALDGVPFFTRGTKRAGDVHAVPLSPQALALLEQTQAIPGKLDLVLAGDAKPWKPLSENTVNTALRTMGYDTKVDICGHGFRGMACSALVESGLWSETAIERQMSHKERNNVRAAYTHKAEFLEERRMIMTWWSRFLKANHDDHPLSPKGRLRLVHLHHLLGHDPLSHLIDPHSRYGAA